MTAADLWIGDNVTLPAEAVTETFGILGQKGSGKSTAAVVMAEEMWQAGLPWVAVDPKGDWWGIRSSADGEQPGLPLPVFGGLHGDVPLEAASGAFVADLLVDENLTAVIDVSDFSKADRARFLVAFFNRIYDRHRANPTVRHLFLEEAHEYIPQMVGREEGRLKEAAARLVLQGRTFGLGVSVCSQRSARIHKDVLTQVGTLIVLRTLAELDRKAIEGWVKEHNVAKELLASLPSLRNGEAWLWSPSFLGRTERIQFRRRATFDSGATPKAGLVARPPATIADVDLAAIKAAMAATIERVQADDPKRLRRRIADLEARLAATPSGGPERIEVPVEVRVEVPLLNPEMAEHLASLTRQVDVLGVLLRSALDRFATPDDVPATPPAVPAEPAVPRRRASRPGPATPVRESTAKLARAERAILTVLAQHGRRTVTQVALLTGYSHKSGGYRNALSSLRSQGYITGRGEVEATTEGVEALGEYEPLPAGRALVEWWYGQLGKAERTILAVLVAVWPQEIPTDDLAVRTGYSATSGGFRNALSRLRSLELAAGRGALRASDVLGEAART